MYHVAKVIVDDKVATWASSRASITGATHDCKKDDPSANLITPDVLDIDCLKNYVQYLDKEQGVTESDIWLDKVCDECVWYDGATGVIKRGDCGSLRKLRFLCARPLNNSKCDRPVFLCKMYRTKRH